MKKHFLPAALAVALLAAAGCGSRDPAPAGPVLRWEDALNDLVAVDSLPDLTPRRFSMLTSYDRAGGNNDFNQFTARGSEPGWVTLADLKGPGIIRRFWMTGTDLHHPVRIFIDGEKTPRIDSTLDALFGGQAPWTPPLAQYINMCYFSYIPITFQRGIRIETREPNVHPLWGPRRLFYQIYAEHLPEGQAVESYPATFTPAQLARAAEVAEHWRTRINDRSLPALDTPPLIVEPGQTGLLLERAGPGSLASWHLQVAPANPAAWTAIERGRLAYDLALRVTYDGAATPSIDVPLGPFFNSGWRTRAVGSLWLTGGPDGFASRLPMPFRQAVRIELVNRAGKPVTARFAAVDGPAPAATDGYLHAEYRRSGPGAPAAHAVARITSGPGKFLGCFLGVTGLDPSWWILEGDERFWVDGQSAPVWHGTGLEDYFNGGWYYRGSAFGGLNGNLDRASFRVAQYRHQQVDPVTFDRSLIMEFERMNHEQNGQPVQGFFESVAYYYLAAPAAVEPFAARADRFPLIPHPNEQPTTMLQLVELERSGDLHGALALTEEFPERFPDSDEIGIYRLRALEYRRLLGEPVGAEQLQPFLDGAHGTAAQDQANLLAWFYEKPDRALVGLHVNGQGRLMLDGRTVLSGDHPYHLFVAGVELEGDRVALAAQVDWKRDGAWLQAGLRTHTGVSGTGPGTAASREAAPSWRTDPVASLGWHRTGIRDIPRGVPDAPFIGGHANAFVLLQAQSYPVSAPDWMYYKGTGYFRTDLDLPLPEVNGFSLPMTGLDR